MPVRFLLFAACAVALGACGGDDSPLTLRSGGVVVDDEDGGVPSLPAPERPIAGAPEGSTIVTGMVEPIRFETVDFDVPGVVGEVLVQRGQEVRRGQVLATLETAERQARLDEVRGRLRSAKRNLPAGRQRRGGELPGYLRREMETRLADVEQQARHRVKDRADFQRRVARGGDEEELRDLVLDIAQQRNEKPRTAAIKRAHQDQLAVALVDDLGSRARQLEDALKSSSLESPLDGVVVAMSVRPGMAWNTRSGDSAFEIVDPTALVVRAEVPRTRADAMQIRELVWVEFNGRAVVQAGVQEVGEDVRQGFDEATGTNRPVRIVTFSLPAKLPDSVEVGADARVALQP